MKIKTSKKHKNKILLLDLLKLKLHKKEQPKYFGYDSKQVELYLKKTLSIIYKYHIKNKKILFFEFPKTFNKTLRRTGHTLIPNSIFYSGFLNNITYTEDSHSLTNKQAIIPSSKLKTLLKLNKKVNLIVIYNPNDQYKTLIKESLKSKIPTIGSYTNNDSQKMLDIKETYKLNVDYDYINEKKPNNDFFFAMIKTIMKKAILNKKKSSRKRRILPPRNIIRKRKYVKKPRKKNKKL